MQILIAIMVGIGALIISTYGCAIIWRWMMLQKLSDMADEQERITGLRVYGGILHRDGNVEFLQ